MLRQWEPLLMALLSTPAMVIGLVCFLVSAALLLASVIQRVSRRRKLLPTPLTVILAVLFVISALYLAFILWLVIAAGSNPGPTPTPH